MEECRRFLVLVGGPSLHVISLHLEKIVVDRHLTQVCRISETSIQNDFCIEVVLLEYLCRLSGSS